MIYQKKIWPECFQAVCSLLVFFCALVAVGAEPVVYNRDIRPILSENCFYCHGSDNNNRRADLRLDDRASAIEAGAIVPRDAAASGILSRIHSGVADELMPPSDSNRKLSSEQKALLKRWIEEGASYQPHWSFNTIQKPDVPKTNKEWVRNSIDSFVLRRLKQEGLTPTAQASPERWLRRVSFDLTGLPPSPSEIDAFVAQVKLQGEAAYETMVDRLLASPHYGERMAIHWLDVARYADTHGFNNDSTRSMWRWRDWVIESFNRNQPYNEFITEQLAGDLLPNPTLDQLIATGFNRNHVINSEGGIIEEEYRVEYVADRVRTLSMAWLGLTMECTRCHDHKYDPFTQRDFYRMFAFFNNVQEWGEDGRVANAPPMIQAPTRDQQEQLATLEKQIAVLETELKADLKNWSFDESMASTLRQVAEQATEHLPKKTAFTLGESNPNGLLADVALSFPRAEKEVSISSKKLRYGQGTPMSFAFWLRQAEDGPATAPLISAIDYSLNPSSQRYGKGVDVRLVNGEIEYCLSRRFPAYTITVRTKGANIQPSEWHHVAVIYQGSAGQKHLGRCMAEWVRIWIDGELVDLDIRHDDLQYGSPNSNGLGKQWFRIGHSSKPGSKKFHGKLAKLNAFRRALLPEEVASLFTATAIPHALAQQSIASHEQRWLQNAHLTVTNKNWATQYKKLRHLKSEQLNTILSAPSTMVMREMPTVRQSHILLRGMYDQPGDAVEPGVIEMLLPMPKDAPANRLGLAQWLTDPNHPLTSRVVVNRFWQQLFGVGFVKTSEDFGFQGEWPSHPELFDWLAADFKESGWNVKRLMKQIVLSSTYRQDSDASLTLLKRDPENRLLARGARFRLPAELVRDQALTTSGLLVRTIGGPSVRPYQPSGLYKGIVVGSAYPGTTWTDSKGDGLYRRSLYTFWKRTAPHPAMVGFDAPDREFCTVRRSLTNTPLQALHLLNGPIYLEASRKLAERVLNSNASREERIALAFRFATGRKPRENEVIQLSKLLDKTLNDFKKDTESAKQLLAIGKSPVSNTIDQNKLAAWTVVASVLFNLDETITRN